MTSNRKINFIREQASLYRAARNEHERAVASDKIVRMIMKDETGIITGQWDNTQPALRHVLREALQVIGHRNNYIDHEHVAVFNFLTRALTRGSQGGTNDRASAPSPSAEATPRKASSGAMEFLAEHCDHYARGNETERAQASQKINAFFGRMSGRLQDGTEKTASVLRVAFTAAHEYNEQNRPGDYDHWALGTAIHAMPGIARHMPEFKKLVRYADDTISTINPQAFTTGYTLASAGSGLEADQETREETARYYKLRGFVHMLKSFADATGATHGRHFNAVANGNGVMADAQIEFILPGRDTPVIDGDPRRDAQTSRNNRHDETQSYVREPSPNAAGYAPGTYYGRASCELA